MSDSSRWVRLSGVRNGMVNCDGQGVRDAVSDDARDRKKESAGLASVTESR